MNSSRAAALRLILPFEERGATVDFFEPEGDIDLVDATFGLDDALLAGRGDDDDRLEDDRDEDA